MGEDGIVIKTSIDTSGFKSGTEEMKQMTDSLVSSAKTSFDGIQKSAEDAFKGIGSSAQSLGSESNSAFEQMSQGATSFSQVMSSAWGAFSTTVKTGFEKLKAEVRDVTKGLGTGLKNLAKNGISGMKGMGRETEGFVKKLIRIGPSLVGVGGALQILRKATNAYMSENKKLSETMQANWRALGSAIGPIIETLVSFISRAISYFMQLLQLLGLSSKSASQASKKASGAAKEMKSVMGFDELNKLQDNSGGGGGATLEDLELPDWIKDIVEMIKQGKFKEAGKALADGMNTLVNSVDWAAKGKQLGEKITHFLDFIVSFIKNFDWKNLGIQIMNFLNSAIKEINWTEVGELLASKFYIAIRFLGGLLENLDGKVWGTAVTDTQIGFYKMISEAIKGVDMKKVGANIAEFIRNIDFVEIVKAGLQLGRDIAGAIVDGIAGFFLGEDADTSGLQTALPHYIHYLFKSCRFFITNSKRSATEHFLFPSTISMYLLSIAFITPVRLRLISNAFSKSLKSSSLGHSTTAYGSGFSLHVPSSFCISNISFPSIIISPVYSSILRISKSQLSNSFGMYGASFSCHMITFSIFGINIPKYTPKGL